MLEKLISRLRGDSSERIAIYTAIFGRYDALRAQPVCADADFICFTDHGVDEPHGWKVVVEEGRYDTPRMCAKWYKLHPHLALKDYRYTIWIDAGVVLSRRSFARKFVSHLGDAGIALLPHPHRDNIFDEAAASKPLPKYEGLPLEEQVEHYRAQGYQSKNGLYCGTVIVRDNANPSIGRLGEAWMAENLAWTYQDQLSLPYVLHQHGIEPAILPYDLMDNRYFVWSNLANAR